MSLDVGEIGIQAARLMDELAEDFADGDETRVRAVALVVALEDNEASWISYRCSDRSPWVQRAIFREALELADGPPDDITERDDG